MNTILATAYAINPYKGSEDGMGWNFVTQIAKKQHVIAITRKNNRAHIERFQEEHPEIDFSNITFGYYDLPYWMRFWKKGGRGAMLYYYLWQLFMPVFILSKKYRFDICHNLNFHNDWTPSFLWVFRKPFVWGPVGHHPFIPNKYLSPHYGKIAQVKNSLLWAVKKCFWWFDPFLKISKWSAQKVICMNSEAKSVLSLPKHKAVIMPSVASEPIEVKLSPTDNKFNILSIGRFVSLKAFDVTINAFADFRNRLPKEQQPYVSLTLIGDGPALPMLEKLLKKNQIDSCTNVVKWVEREKLAQYYADASAFFFPTHEGAGMVIAEAMSYGLPIICFDNCGPGEFITRQSGISIPYTSYNQSIREFGDALMALFKDKTIREELSKGALARFDSHFNWDRRGELLNDIYNSILEDKITAETAILAKATTS